MPFIGYKIGIHDASWRNGVFGGEIYKYNGSGACVNASEEAAQYLYYNTDVGTKVLVHK